MTVYLLCFVLFLVGLYGLLTRRNLIKIIISKSITEFSVFLMLALIGYIDGGLAPIVKSGSPHQVYVDPLPQAMVLTAIVIGLGVTAVMLSYAVRIYKARKTLMIDECMESKW